MMSRKEQHDQGGHRDQREDAIVSTEHAPGGAGIAPMDQLEEPGHDLLLLSVAQIIQHDQLSKLVDREHHQG